MIFFPTLSILKKVTLYLDDPLAIKNADNSHIDILFVSNT